MAWRCQKGSGEAPEAKVPAPNREGKPWKRADGRWTVRVYPPEESTDPRPRQVYGKTRKEVIAKRDELEGKLTKGLPKDPDQTVGDYFHRWLYTTLPQYVAAGELAESTMDSYRENAAHAHRPRAPGVPTLRHIKLTALSGPVIREWQDRLGQKPAGRAAPHAARGRERTPATRDALPAHRRLLPGHPSQGAGRRDPRRGGRARPERRRQGKPPRKRQQKARVIVTPEQAGALLAEMDEDRLWCYWLLAFALGFRRGEGLGMRWSDLDLRSGRGSRR